MAEKEYIERERLIQLMTFAPPGEDGNGNVYTLADHLLKNGVIVPPCKVGDYVYYIKGGYYKKPQFCEVSRPCKVVEVSFKLQRNGSCVMRGFITDNGTRYNFDSIGKNVFLTKEEAEKALAERRAQK